MKYRKFGPLEWESSILGFGTAGLQLFGNEVAPHGSTASVEMVRDAIDRGINYVDLGYPYDLRRHERLAHAIGEALQDGYFEKIKICVTLPSHLLNSTSDFDLFLNRQLKWLKADKINFCLFGKLNRDIWPILRKLGATAWADSTIAEGRIEAIGFSFHDHFQVLRQILTAYEDWSFCQFQFSYMDTDHDPGIGGIKYASSKGLAVVATEPLKGGRLAKEPPWPVGKIWSEGGGMTGMAEWGMRFVWNIPEVATVVRDFRSIHDLSENVNFANRAEADHLTVQDELLINNVRDAYRKRRCVQCSSCRSCMPCPEGIDVPRLFELYNDALIYEDFKTARLLYRNELHNADRCNRCLECEKRCPRKLEIVALLEQAHKLLAR